MAMAAMNAIAMPENTRKKVETRLVHSGTAWEPRPMVKPFSATADRNWLGGGRTEVSEEPPPDPAYSQSATTDARDAVPTQAGSHRSLSITARCS